MAQTLLRGEQVTDGSIKRDDLNVSTAGQAVIRKVIAGTNISLTYTGTDSGTGDVTISALQEATVVNAIRNGCGRINQRGVSGSVVLTAGQYGHDGYKVGAAGCTYTFATVNNKVTFTISSGSLINTAEGEDLQSGLYVASWEGTAHVKIGAGSYAATGVTGTAVGGTAKTLEIGAGTLSNLLFEPGSVPSKFPVIDKGLEQRRCQEYVADVWISQRCYPVAANVLFDSQFNFPVEMRRVPTGPTTIVGGAVNNITSSTAYNVTKKGFRQSTINTAAYTDTYLVDRSLRFTCEA